MLAIQHLLNLRVAERVEDAADVDAQFFGYVHSRFVAAMAMGVEQTRHELVPAIERYPATVQIEIASSDVAAANFLKYYSPRFHRVASTASKPRNETVGALCLAEGQFIDDIDDAALTFGVAGLRMHEAQGRQIVPQGMTADGVALPAGIHRTFRRQACLAAKVMQQPIRLQSMQILEIDADCREIR